MVTLCNKRELYDDMVPSQRDDNMCFTENSKDLEKSRTSLNKTISFCFMIKFYLYIGCAIKIRPKMPN